ncbi:UDP-2,3-diacylglucosamine diphosphatase [Ramlibacter alkalitolerans]|uniref:UDP-2,3-diacylglucosamine diphosphatase n=1 Tax=Ramlibacter alkalitolerans TaxID=2039631 RepID=UPI002ED4831C
MAPPLWRSVECISDLHLQAGHAGTFEAWRRYMAASAADALFLLGDLFEAWVGDDVLEAEGFEAECAEVLRAAAWRVPLFFMVGNRDFLVGQGLAQATGMTLLQDPTVFTFGGRRWLLSHGDALCVGDTDYQAFRAQVRGSAWQQGFLAQPLSVRQAVARGLREESEALKATDRVYSDVDTAAALQWLEAADAEVLVHGHTHKPGEHTLDARHRRIVLTDWDAAATPPRLEALRIAREGTVQRVGLA